MLLSYRALCISVLATLFCCAPLSSANHPITIEWETPSATLWRVDESVRLTPAQESVDLPLAEGSHRVRQVEGGSDAEHWFEVLTDGTVDFDPSLDGILGGRGTNTLLVNPHQVTVRWDPASTAPWLVGSGTTQPPETTVQVFGLLPGVHAVGQDTVAAGSAARLSFRVDSAGIVQREGSGEPFDQRLLSGEGTRIVGVHPIDFKVRWSKLPPSKWFLDSYLVSPYLAETMYKLLPGVHAVRMDTRIHPPVDHLFQIDASGRVRDPGVGEMFTAGFFGGIGTTTLEIHPIPLVIEWSEPASHGWWVGTGWGGSPGQATWVKNLLPGTWPMRSSRVVPAADSPRFRVGFDGRFYPAAPSEPFDNGLYSGIGTSKLQVHPHCIGVTFDDPNRESAWRLEDLPGFMQAFPTSAVRVLPGERRLKVVDGDGNQEFGTIMVTDDGTVSPPELQLAGTTLRFSEECEGPLSTINSSLGNSFSGLPFQQGQYGALPNDFRHMLVTGDGTVFITDPWDESSREVFAIQDGQIAAVAGLTHGYYSWPTTLAANSKHVFIAHKVTPCGNPSSCPPSGREWSVISRRQRSNIELGAPFPGGIGGSLWESLGEDILLLD